jgi:hypothetical protein
VRNDALPAKLTPPPCPGALNQRTKNDDCAVACRLNGTTSPEEGVQAGEATIQKCPRDLHSCCLPDKDVPSTCGSTVVEEDGLRRCLGHTCNSNSRVPP